MATMETCESLGQWSRAYASARNAATALVRRLLDEEPLAGRSMVEASVHRSKRSRVWLAAFTGPSGGRIWKSTGTADRGQALALAKRWEAHARAQRLRSGRGPAKPFVRVVRSELGTGAPGLTQREIGLLLNLSERSVREIERRAFRKLRAHPALRQVWQQFLSGELGEDYWSSLSQAEEAALLRLARTMEERRVVRKVLRLVGR
jgi:hypothetical protein